MTTSKMITKAVSTALMAVAAVGASAGAFAATNPTQGATDLFVAVWNTTTNTSYVEDLGTPSSDLATTFNNSGFTTSWNVDNGQLATTLGSGTYQYQVFAGFDASGSTIKNNSAYLSLAAGVPIPSDTITNTEIVNNALVSISNYLSAFLPGSVTSYTSLNPVTTGGGDSWVSNNTSSPGFDFQVNSLLGISSATVGNPLTLVDYLAADNKAFDTPAITGVGANGALGLFNLSADGLLTYDAGGGTSPVPLPPAGWLLISGLLGLLAVGRRRGAEAV